ncbi:ORF1 [Anelloviridae sp.]|nr:ORF1 [Anelloviridae sp.]
MPPYWNYRKRRYPWRRRYWYRRWRTGKTFRRRWRRRKGVRNYFSSKRKLKKITVKDWQPPCIKKCKIKGKTCILYFNPKRIANNSTMYEDSSVPAHLPGGGGFGVQQYTLEFMYEQHSKCRNWWTASNIDLPLCRYTGCKIRLYQCKEIDYAVRYSLTLPTHSNKLTYPSCQGSIMLMSQNKIIVPSQQNQRRKHPYKTLKLHPPSQWSTKWYFQADIYKQPVLLLHVSAISLPYYYLKPTWESNNITITFLNTFLVQNRNWNQKPTIQNPYYYKQLGTLNHYMYKYQGNQTTTDNFEIGDLIPLCNTKYYIEGEAPNHYATQQVTTAEKYVACWGNPFHPDNIEDTEHIYISHTSPTTVWNSAIENQTSPPNWKKKWSQITTKTALTKLDENILLRVRYNPNTDTGQNTKAYLLPNNVQGHGWDPLNIPETILDGFPLWLIVFGYTDFQKKLKKLLKIDTDYMLVLKSEFTTPKYHQAIVPIDESFEKGYSPYLETIENYDKDSWFPQTQYQQQSINTIAHCGPGTPYTTSKSENITMGYTFYWKWGGSPPKSVNIDDPAHQEVYPIPRNQYETTSLQNPAQAPETVLYSFDFRHGQYTDRAIERLKSDWETQSLLSSITETSSKGDLHQAFKALQNEEKETEKTQEALLKQLQQHKQQQLILRQRIASLLDKIASQQF